MTIGQFMPMSAGVEEPLVIEYVTGTTAGVSAALWNIGTFTVPKTGWYILVAGFASLLTSGKYGQIFVDNVESTLLRNVEGTSNGVASATMCKALLTAGSHVFKVTKTSSGFSAGAASFSIYSASADVAVFSSSETGTVSLEYQANSYAIFATQSAGQDTSAHSYSSATMYNLSTQSLQRASNALKFQVEAGTFTEIISIGSGISKKLAITLKKA